jgi:cytochrome P450
MLAGHETTANTLNWTLFELCRHPEVQNKLRLEIRAQELKIRERRESDFTWKDYESMPYLNAVVKVDLLAEKFQTMAESQADGQESLRFNTVAYNIYRQPTSDEVLPLSQPIHATTGELLHELPIPKGMKLLISIAGYNR